MMQRCGVAVLEAWNLCNGNHCGVYDVIIIQVFNISKQC